MPHQQHHTDVFRMNKTHAEVSQPSRRQTADALPAIGRAARSRGLALVTMDALMGPA